jgi:hypothetical protein
VRCFNMGRLEADPLFFEIVVGTFGKIRLICAVKKRDGKYTGCTTGSARL